MHDTHENDAQANGADQVHDQAAHAFAQAIATLTEQLGRANHRVDTLEAILADAKSALAISTDSARALQAKLDRRDEWSFMRRLKWALHRR
jgi:hypothetical protein